MTTNNDPARSALAAFVSACGGNPPDWLRKEHAAAENALAAKPEPLAEFRCSGLDNESGLRFSDTLWARGIEEAETAAEMRWPDVEGWTIEAVEPEPPADTTQAAALRQIRGLATWESAKAKGEIYRVATEALGGEGGAPAGNSPWDALEAAQFWLQEEANSAHPGQTKPDDILRVIGDALAGRPARADAYEIAARAAGWRDYEHGVFHPASNDYADDWRAACGISQVGPDHPAKVDAAPASPPSVADVLARAESFIAGFEDDETQEGVTGLLRDLRAAQGKEG